MLKFYAYLFVFSIMISPLKAMERPEQPTLAGEMLTWASAKITSLAESVIGADRPKTYTLVDMDKNTARQLFFETPLVLSSATIKNTILDQVINLHKVQVSNPKHIVGQEVDLSVGDKLCRFQVTEFFYGHRHHAVDWALTNSEKVLGAILIYYLTPQFILTVATATVVFLICCKNFEDINKTYNYTKNNLSWEGAGKAIQLTTSLSEDLEKSRQELQMSFLKDNKLSVHSKIPGSFGKYKVLDIELKFLGELR